LNESLYLDSYKNGVLIKEGGKPGRFKKFLPACFPYESVWLAIRVHPWLKNPSELPPGFGLRQSSGAFAFVVDEKAVPPPPHSKTAGVFYCPRLSTFPRLRVEKNLRMKKPLRPPKAA